MWTLFRNSTQKFFKIKFLQSSTIIHWTHRPISDVQLFRDILKHKGWQSKLQNCELRDKILIITSCRLSVKRVRLINYPIISSYQFSWFLSIFLKTSHIVPQFHVDDRKNLAGYFCRNREDLQRKLGVRGRMLNFKRKI